MKSELIIKKFKSFKKSMKFVLAGALLVSSLSLVGCGGNAGNNPAPGTSDPKTSGTITVYTALEDEQVTAYLAEFNKKYPNIKVNIVRESTGIITAKLLAEKDNIQADAVWGTAASSMLVLDEKGMLKEYAPEGVDRILPKFKSEKTVPTWVGIDAWETAIVVNTDEAKKKKLPKITSYKDLLKPEFKGNIVMSNPNSSGTGFLTVSALLQLYGKDNDKGWKFLEDLDKNVSMYVHSGSKPAKMAAAGECPVGISFGYAGITQKQKGAPVEVIFPKEGSGWDLEANALMNKAQINPAAQTFLDWAISEDAMNLYKVNYPIITTKNVGSYDGYDKDPTKQLIKNDFKWAASNREAILAEWMKKFDAKSAAE